MLIINKRGQNTAEYTILLSIVLLAIISMQMYVKRGLSGGTKYVVDKLKRDSSGTGQYEPYYMKSAYDTNTTAATDTEELKAQGEIVRVTGARTITRTGYQNISVPE